MELGRDQDGYTKIDFYTKQKLAIYTKDVIRTECCHLGPLNDSFLLMLPAALGGIPQCVKTAHF